MKISKLLFVKTVIGISSKELHGTNGSQFIYKEKIALSQMSCIHLAELI